MQLTKEIFFDLERRLRDAGLDSDDESFDTIKSRLNAPQKLSPDEFARAAIYVVFAGGFSQKTAKKIHNEIMNYLIENQKSTVENLYNQLIKIFNNKNKINAAIKIWVNRAQYQSGYYALPNDIDVRVAYLQTLPHIGKITANHLARNLGLDIVKYDIWIQRLGVAFSNKKDLESKINNQTLHPDVRAVVDEMFDALVRETGLPRGYIDVVLWKSAQNHLI